MKLPALPIHVSFQQFCENTKPLPLKGWVNLETGEIEKVYGDTHGDQVLENPQAFGVEDEVAKILDAHEGSEDDDDAGLTQECLYAALEGGKWARFENFMGEINVEAKTLGLAEKAFKMMHKAGFYLYERRGVRIEGYSDGQRIILDDAKAIELYLHEGRIKRKRF